MLQKHVDHSSVGLFAGLVGAAGIGAKAEDVGRERLHELEQGLCHFRGDAGLLVGQRVDDAAGIEQVADDDGRVQVVVHRVVELLRQSRNILDVDAGLALHLLAVLEAAQVLQSVHESGQAFLSGLQGFVAEIDGRAIVGLQDEEADGHGRVGLAEQRMVAREELRQRDEVVVGLAHLLAVDGNHVVVHPVVHHLAALAGYGLRYLALVVREDEVHAAAVDVEVFAQILAPHRRAFAVPTGEAVAPRRRPSHDVLGLGGLPEGKVRLVLLLADAGQVAARVLDVLEVSARKDAPAMVLVVLLDVEVDAAVALVGIAVVEDLLDERLLFDDVAGGVRLDAWGQAA